MNSRDIFWIGQVVGETFQPDTSLQNPNIKRNGDNFTIIANNLGNGAYEVKNIPNGDYLFYDGDTLKENVLGNGSGGFRHYFDGNVDGGDVKSGTIAQSHLPDDIPKSKIAGLQTDLDNLNTSLAGKAGLSENNNFTGGNTFEQIITIRQPISTDYADPELDSATSNLVTNARLDYKIAHMEGYTESPNFIRVAPGVRAQTGKVYPTINGAVGAFVNPSASNVCKAFIQGMSSTASYIVPSTATPCIKSYVNLIAADRGIVISFPNVNCTEKVTIENATVVLGGGTNRGGSSSARTWVNINFINCRIYHFKNFTLKGGLLENCTVISPDTITFTADKDINDVYTDIIGSTFRVSPSIIDEASYAGAVDYKVTPSLSVIDDFTMESDT